MSPRERTLAIAVALLAGWVGCRWLVQTGISGPLAAKDRELALLESQVLAKQQEVDQLLDVERDLSDWRYRSLPADVSLAQTLYQDYLHRLLAQSGIERPTITPSAPTRTAHHARLAYGVRMQCTLAQLTRFLHGFHASGFLHQVRRLTIQPARTRRANEAGAVAGTGPDTGGAAGAGAVIGGAAGGLDVSLGIEAVAVEDADATGGLPVPARAGAARLLAERPVSDFALLGAKDPFRPTRLRARAAPSAPPPSPSPEPDERADHVVTGTAVQDGQGQLWLTHRKTKASRVLREGEELAVGGFRARVVRIQPDRVLLEVSGQTGDVLLGRDLATWKRMP